MLTFAKPLILLVEDNPDDVVMIRHALRKANITFPLRLARDGREAIAYLSGEGKYSSPDYPIPALVLLDLKLPKLDGFQVLDWIRGQPHLNAMPVVVLTSSLDPADATRAYEMGANSFLAKPSDFLDAARLMSLIIAQWLPAGLHRRNVTLAAA